MSIDVCYFVLERYASHTCGGASKSLEHCFLGHSYFYCSFVVYVDLAPVAYGYVSCVSKLAPTKEGVVCQFRDHVNYARRFAHIVVEIGDI